MVLVIVALFVSNRTSGGNGESEGDGCRRGLAGIDGDGEGVRNGACGERIAEIYICH